MASINPLRPLAVVTGASSGIGRELAQLAVQDGHDLVIAADQGPLEEAAIALRAGGAHVEAVEADLSTAFGVDKLMLAINGRPVELLIANAGHGLGHGFLDKPFSSTVDASREMRGCPKNGKPCTPAVREATAAWRPRDCRFGSTAMRPGRGAISALAQVGAHAIRAGAHGLHRHRQLLLADAQRVRPVADLVFLAEVDARPIRGAAVLHVVGQWRLLAD